MTDLKNHGKQFFISPTDLLLFHDNLKAKKSRNSINHISFTHDLPPLVLAGIDFRLNIKTTRRKTTDEEIGSDRSEHAHGILDVCLPEHDTGSDE
jgi:hypothetical protein